jgi:hypothetical protein
MDKAQLPPMMGIAQGMGAALVTEIAAPAIVYSDPRLARQDADLIHRLGAALGMDRVVGQCLGARRVQPMQPALDLHTRLIKTHHRRVQQRVLGPPAARSVPRHTLARPSADWRSRAACCWSDYPWPAVPAALGLAPVAPTLGPPTPLSAPPGCKPTHTAL